MAEFYRFLKSRAYMMRHSLFFSAHILIPLAGIFLYLAYMGIRPANGWEHLTSYVTLLAMAYPAVIGIVTAMLTDREAKAGHMQNLLAAPSRVKTLSSELLLFLLPGFLAVGIALFGYQAVLILKGEGIVLGIRDLFFTHICALGIECACLCHSFIFRISFWRRGYHRCRCGGIRHLSRHADRSWGRCLVCVVAILRNALFYSAACLETGGRREFAASDPSWGNLLSYGFCVILGHDIYLVSEI